jgi:hypothetical protein
MDRDSREPRPISHAFLRVGIGSDMELSPRRRFVAPRRVCAHCELPADTNAPTCPVCGALYPARGRLARIRARLRRI